MENNQNLLDWKQRDDGVIHADLLSLGQEYYIYPPKTGENDKNKFALVLLYAKDTFSFSDTTHHDTLEAAKEEAQKYYAPVK